MSNPPMVESAALARSSTRRGLPWLDALRGSAMSVAVGLLLIYPLVSFMLLSFIPHLFGQEGAGVQAFGRALSGYSLHALMNSCFVAVVSAVISVGLGAGLSWLSQRTTLREARWLDGLMWVVLLSPSYLLAVGWMTLLQRGGVLSAAGIDLPWLRSFIMGPGGVILVLALKHVPFCYLTTAPAWSGMGGELEEAARVHGVGQRRLLRLTVGLLTPALVAAFAVSMAESLSDFGVASTLAAGAHFPVATYAIYQALYSNPLDFPLASATSWLLLLISGIALFVQAQVSRRARRFASLTGRSRLLRRATLRPRATLLVRLGLLVLVLLALGVPLLGTISSAFIRDMSQGITLGNLTTQHFVEAAHQGLGGPVAFSALLALGAGTIAVVLGLSLAGMLNRPGKLSRLLDLALLAAMALPGLILAAGYIFAFNQPWLPLYGTVWLLGAAYAAGGMSSSSRLLLGSVTQLGRNLTEAAQVHGLSRASVTIDNELS